MCYAKPGPRCSGHAQKTLNSKSEKLQSVRSDLLAAKKAHEDDPGDADKKAVYVTHARKYRALKKEVERAQRDYDGTPGGRKVLKEQIASERSAKKRADMNKRLRQGKMLYSWRKNQLNMKRAEAKTGKTLKQRRGSFLTNPGYAAA